MRQKRIGFGKEVTPQPTPTGTHDAAEEDPGAPTVETYHTEDAVTFLLDHLPISTTTLHVKVFRHGARTLSATMYGYSRKRDFDAELQKRVEQNQLQHGQETLGTPIDGLSINRLHESFLNFSDGGHGSKGASGYGRVGVAVITSLLSQHLSNHKAVVSTTKSEAIQIKLTGISLLDAGNSTASLAKDIASHTIQVLPEHAHLNDDEFNFYLQKARALDSVPPQFAYSASPSAGATAADFPSIVTSLSLTEEEGSVKEAAAAPAYLEQKAYYRDGGNIGRNIGNMWSTLGAPPNMAISLGTDSTHASSPLIMDGLQGVVEGSVTYGQATTLLLAGQNSADHFMYPNAGLQPLDTNYSRHGKTSKRTVDDAELDDRANIFPRTNDVLGPVSRPRKTSSQIPAQTAAIPIFSAPGLIAPPPAKKPIPTRAEIHKDYLDQNLDKYTVIQLRDYLNQEGLNAGLTTRATKPILLQRIHDIENPEFVFQPVAAPKDSKRASTKTLLPSSAKASKPKHHPAFTPAAAPGYGATYTFAPPHASLYRPTPAQLGYGHHHGSHGSFRTLDASALGVAPRPPSSPTGFGPPDHVPTSASIDEPHTSPYLQEPEIRNMDIILMTQQLVNDTMRRAYNSRGQ